MIRPPRTSIRRNQSETTRGPKFESRAYAMGLSEDGFSLVELLISAILLSILMASIVMAVRMSQTVHNSTQQSLELQQNVRASISMISRELLNAGSALPYLSPISGNPAIPVPAGRRSVFATTR